MGVALERRAGGSIVNGDTVATNEDFELQICLSRDAYVYVAQASSDRTAALLYPPPGADAVLPSGEHRMPPSGSWFYTKPPDGDDTLIVIASSEPIAMTDPAIAAAVGELPEPVEIDAGVAVADAGVAVVEAPRPDAGVVAVARTHHRAGGSHRAVPRDDDSWTPDRQELASFHPRGLTARAIGVRGDCGETFSEEDGAIVRVVTFSHEAR